MLTLNLKTRFRLAEDVESNPRCDAMAGDVPINMYVIVRANIVGLTLGIPTIPHEDAKPLRRLIRPIHVLKLAACIDMRFCLLLFNSFGGFAAVVFLVLLFAWRVCFLCLLCLFPFFFDSATRRSIDSNYLEVYHNPG